MSFDVAIDSVDFAARWDASYQAAQARLLSVAQALDTALVALAQAKADGDVLQVRTGAYLRSIHGSVSASGTTVVASVWSDAPFAGTIEYGAETSAHDILPDLAQALRFDGDAGAVYAKVIHDPGAHIKAHPVVHAALDEMRSEIMTRLQAALDGFGG